MKIRSSSPSEASPSSQIIRAYFEANRCMLTHAREIPLAISTTFLGVALWGFHRADPGEPLALEELGHRLALGPTTISQHLRYLGAGYRAGQEGLGLVETAGNPDNRRKKRVYLTTKGRTLISQLEFVLTERR